MAVVTCDALNKLTRLLSDDAAMVAVLLASEYPGKATIPLLVFI